MKKWGHLPIYYAYTQSYGHKISKMTHFLCFLPMTAKINLSLGKIFKYISRILFSFFRKCYGLLGFELPLAKYQPLKIQDCDIFLLTQHFFLIFLPSIFHER